MRINIIAVGCIAILGFATFISGCDKNSAAAKETNITYKCGTMRGQKVTADKSYMVFPVEYIGIEQWVANPSKKPDLINCNTPIRNITLNAKLPILDPLSSRKFEATEKDEITVTYSATDYDLNLSLKLESQVDYKTTFTRVADKFGYETYLSEHFWKNKSIYRYFFVKRSNEIVTELTSCFYSNSNGFEMCRYSFRDISYSHVKVTADAKYLGNTLELKKYVNQLFSKIKNI